MKKIIYALTAGSYVLFLQSCITQQHATTIERDKDNPCKVQMVIQLGIDGTDGDVDSVRMQLEDCFGKDCAIPCPNGKGGCSAHTSVVVIKWSDIPAKDTNGYHHIKMVPQDNLPSFVDAIGTPNGGPTGGTWRRSAYPRTYCHEVLHLCGLPDQYCARIWDSINNSIITDVKCNPGPDPKNDSCCDPKAAGVIAKRCGNDCPGHDHDIMSNLSTDLSCANIIDVLTRAGFASCPEECCNRPITETAHVAEPKLRIGASYYTGYEAYLTIDNYNPSNVLKETYNGANLGASFDVKYEVIPKLDLWGRLRVVDFSHVVNKNHDEYNVGNTSVETNSTSAFQFHQTGLDFNLEYEAYPNLRVFGGPSLDLNWLTVQNSFGSSSTTINGMATTNSFGDKKFEKIDMTYWKNNVATGGFNLGASYELHPCHNWTAEPYINARFPFSQPLSYKPAPKNFKNYLFSVNAGATFTFGF